MTHLTRKVLTFLMAFVMIASTTPIYGEFVDVSAEEQLVTESIVTGTFGETGTYTYDTETHTLTLENEVSITASAVAESVSQYWETATLIIGEGVESVQISTYASEVYISASVTKISVISDISDNLSRNKNLTGIYVDKNNKKYTENLST